ncbi:MAG: DUF5320 domain-containing protein [Thermoproteota archaeon]
MWRNWSGPYPGRGPFSNIPPWQRPGWYIGRGWCWRHFYPYWKNAPVTIMKTEIDALEAYRAELEEELKSVEARIKELKESMSKETAKQQ